MDHPKQLLLLGLPEVGKSTLAGRAIHQYGGIDTRTMETLQAGGMKTYTDAYNLIRASDSPPEFYLPPRQKVRFIRDVTASPDAAVLVVAPGVTGLDEMSKEWPLEITELFRSKKVIIVVNKMDKHGWSSDAFQEAVRAVQQELKLHSIECEELPFVPVSATEGVNFIEPSKELSWYMEADKGNTVAHKGLTLLDALKVVINN